MKHCDYALEYCKVFITLATALLGLSATFVEKFAMKGGMALAFLITAWLFWIGSIYFGSSAIRGLVTIAYRMESSEEDKKELSVPIEDTIFSPGIRRDIDKQFMCFGIGFIAFMTVATVAAIAA